MLRKLKNYKGHLHGCGHPVRPVLMDDNPLSIVESGWLEWNEQHEKAEANGEKCICFFCWEKSRQEELTLT